MATSPGDRLRCLAREFTRIGFIGLGTMGAGIAEVFARHGYDVVGVEVDDDGAERGRQHLANSTDRAVTTVRSTTCLCSMPPRVPPCGAITSSRAVEAEGARRRSLMPETS